MCELTESQPEARENWVIDRAESIGDRHFWSGTDSDSFSWEYEICHKDAYQDTSFQNFLLIVNSR